MKNIIVVLPFVIITMNSYSQNIGIDSLSYNEILQRVVKLEQRTQELTIQVAGNSEKVALLGEAVEQKVGGLHEKMDSIYERYGLRMTNAETAVQETGTRQQKSIVWGVIIAVVICSLLTMAYLILRKRINRKGVDIEQLRAKADSLNEQIVQRMDKELAELKQIVDKQQTAGIAKPSAEPDHSLVKALADRITFMEMTLYRMDSSVKGHKHLTKSIKSMKDNLLANGYELVEMLGKDYVEGMNASTSFNDDENMEQGKRIITGITKPQINYKGKMIQAAQITVSQNI